MSNLFFDININLFLQVFGEVALQLQRTKLNNSFGAGSRSIIISAKTFWCTSHPHSIVSTPLNLVRGGGGGAWGILENCQTGGGGGEK